MKKIVVIALLISVSLFIGTFSKEVYAIDNGSSKNSTAQAKSNSLLTNNKKPWSWPTKKWSISTPEEQGMDSKILLNAVKRINENYPNIYSLLVVRHGYLVYEKYFQGMDKYSANPVFSVTKSVMSALTGIAIREKIIKNIDQRVSDFFPEYFSKIDNSEKKKITLKNILTMSGGLETIDTDYNSYFASPDWLKYTIDKPLVDKPGQKFVYNTGLPHFLSGIITKKSKMDTLEFANKYLFNKIGMSVLEWDMDYHGYNWGGAGLYLTPEDMAKFGLLYLKKGLWDGKQIIPQTWVEESTKKQISAADLGLDYGYLFWLEKMRDKVHNRDYFTYRADGSGGQKIVIIPELDMVAVITANSQSSSKDKSNTLDIIPQYVIPAVK